MLFVHEVFGLALVMKFQIFLTFVGYNLRMCLTKHIFLRDNQGGGSENFHRKFVYDFCYPQAIRKIVPIAAEKCCPLLGAASVLQIFIQIKDTKAISTWKSSK